MVDNIKDVEVINIDSEGNIIEDLSKVVIPEDHMIYDVMERIAKGLIADGVDLNNL